LTLFPFIVSAKARVLVATTVVSKNGGSLLAYAVSRLRPDVFMHPIWVYFGDQEKPVSSETIDELLSAAKHQQNEDPGGACRILFICAVHLNYAGQRAEALTIMQKILALAEGHGLAEEIIWANWGACAICFQDGDIEGATEYLQNLQVRLRGQDEWILANFVDAVEQSLLQPNPIAKAGEPVSSDDRTHAGLMRLTFDWLQQWGYSVRMPIPEFQPIPNFRHHPDRKGAAMGQPTAIDWHWRSYWHKVKQIVRGEMRLQWVLNSAPRRASGAFQQTSYSPPQNSEQIEPFPSLTDQSPSQDRPRTDLTGSPHLVKPSAEAALLVYCLGTFLVYQDEQPVEDWPSTKGKAVFKYLVTHRERPVIKDVLMDIFWPDIPAESARNNLNVAIYGLRQALRKEHPSYSHVLFINDCYLLNPELQIWLDYEAFLQNIAAARKLEKSGDLEATISEYSKAEALYQGEFLVEDRYEDWLLPLRENLQAEYISLLDRLNHHFFKKEDYQACIHLCRKMLTIDPCSEEAHRHLMRCFFELEQSYMALRQYHLCVEALKKGLSVNPASATKELYEYIRRHS